MSHFGDRKKRIALAMGIASFLGAGKVSMAKGKPAASTKVSTQGGLFSNVTAGKAARLTAVGVGTAALIYELIADTAAKNTKMPSIAKAFGWVKGKQDDQKKDKKDDQKKDDSEGDKMSKEICEQIAGCIGSYGKVLEDDKGLRKEVAIKILVETAKLAGVTKETLKYNAKDGHYSRGAKDNSKVYCFLVPIARKIGLSEERFSDNDIWDVCCHNFAEAKSKALAFKVKGGVAITEYERGALMLISQLRNIMNYNAGCSKSSNFIEGDLLKALQALE